MSTRAFFDDAAKAAVKGAIERVERQTSAELVVTVRHQAGLSYTGADLAFGGVVALLTLTAVLFVDREFDTRWIPVDILVVFLLATLLCRTTQVLRRLLVPAARREAEAQRAAGQAFHELGVGRTRGRNGILVLVALFERKVALVADVGVDRALLADAVAKINAAVDQLNPDRDAFVTALDTIGAALAATMPCGPDDVNELSDDVGVQ